MSLTTKFVHLVGPGVGAAISSLDDFSWVVSLAFLHPKDNYVRSDCRVLTQSRIDALLAGEDVKNIPYTAVFPKYDSGEKLIQAWDDLSESLWRCVEQCQVIDFSKKKKYYSLESRDFFSRVCTLVKELRK